MFLNDLAKIVFKIFHTSGDLMEVSVTVGFIQASRVSNSSFKKIKRIVDRTLFYKLIWRAQDQRIGFLSRSFS